MRKISSHKIASEVAKLCQSANYTLGDDVIQALQAAKINEKSAAAQEILKIILKNYQIAAQESLPSCQDTGTAVVFVEVGQAVQIIDGDLNTAINRGVAQGYDEGYLRKSIVRDPVFGRINTNDNTPAVIHTQIVAGEEIRITLAPKGGGAENMSRIAMLKPADGLAGVMDFVIETVNIAGGNPCPPIVVGVGVGGNFEACALLAKEALLRKIGSPNSDNNWAKVETDLLEKINQLGIGAQGLGGTITALAVHINTAPSHIASLPVAVNMQCHAARHQTIII